MRFITTVRGPPLPEVDEMWYAKAFQMGFPHLKWTHASSTEKRRANPTNTCSNFQLVYPAPGDERTVSGAFSVRWYPSLIIGVTLLCKVCSFSIS